MPRHRRYLFPNVVPILFVRHASLADRWQTVQLSTNLHGSRRCIGVSACRNRKGHDLELFARERERAMTVVDLLSDVQGMLNAEVPRLPSVIASSLAHSPGLLLESDAIILNGK